MPLAPASGLHPLSDVPSHSAQCLTRSPLRVEAFSGSSWTSASESFTNEKPASLHLPSPAAFASPPVSPSPSVASTTSSSPPFSAKSARFGRRAPPSITVPIPAKRAVNVSCVYSLQTEEGTRPLHSFAEGVEQSRGDFVQEISFEWKSA